MSECSTLLTSRSGVCSVRSCLYRQERPSPLSLLSLVYNPSREKLPVTSVIRRVSPVRFCHPPVEVTPTSCCFFIFTIILSCINHSRCHFYPSLENSSFFFFFCRSVVSDPRFPRSAERTHPPVLVSLHWILTCAFASRGASRRCSLTVTANPDDLRPGVLCSRTPLRSDCICFRLPPPAERLSVPTPLPAWMSVTRQQPLF